jgi:hypothetical protein
METILLTFRALTCESWGYDVLVDVVGDAHSVQPGIARHPRAQSGRVPDLPYPRCQANIQLMDL